MGAAIPDNKPWSTGISGSNSFATRTFAYDAGLQPTTETFGSSGLFPNRVVTRDYEPSGSGYVHGRSSGFEVSTSPAYAASYAYDGTTGRLNRVTGPGLPTGTGANYGAWYLYRSGSDLVGQTQFKSDDNTKLLPAIRAYETDRDLLSHVNAYWRPDGANNLISSYFYRNDALGRRWAVSNQGLAFAATGDRVSVWSHNDRNELTASHRYEGIDPEDPGDPVPTEQFTYAYDPIGNRTDATEGTTVTSDYHPNDLNQYGFIRTNTTGGNPAVQYPTYDADGNLSETYVVGDMNGDGRCDNFDLSMFSYAVTHTEGDFEAQYPNGCFWCADINGDALVNNFDITPFMALLGENAAIDVRYTWDAENRLIAVEPGGTPASGDVKLTFAYDYMGRRIEKKVYDWDSQAQDWEETPSLDRRFVWAGGGTGGWLMLMELDGLDSNAVVRQYTWGLDLAGQSGVASGGPAGRLDGLEAAGSIGGLLAVHDETVGENGADYVYTYDANGNVGQVIDLSAASATASIVAHYEYDPYGNVTSHSGDYADVNPFRFSTKYWDDETGLGYWGYRYYSSILGRWMSHDPNGEVASQNLYAGMQNRPSDLIDAIGLRPIVLDFNAFISSRYGSMFVEPWANPFSTTWYVETDNRTHGQPGTSRIRSSVIVESKQLGCGCATEKGCFSVSVQSDPSVRHSFPDDGPMVTQTRRSQPEWTHGFVRRKCYLKVEVEASGSYPFLWYAPSIDFEVVWELRVIASDTVEVTLSGSHDRFPDYEGLVDSSLLYTYARSSSGPGVWSLGPFKNPFSGGRHPIPFGPITTTVSAETPCCP